MSTYTTFVDCGSLGDQEITFHYTCTTPRITATKALDGDPGNPPDTWSVDFIAAFLGPYDILAYVPEAYLSDLAINLVAMAAEGAHE